MFCPGEPDRPCISVCMHAADHFDRLYRQSERYWWRDKDRYATDQNAYPYSLLTQHTLRLLSGQPAGRALDLGAGEGADAIRLALLGYQVDAVEVSEVAAGKISRFARDAGVRVGVTVCDVRKFIPEYRYDVIICNGVLHYLDEKEHVVTGMQAATMPGGINVISLWSSYTAVPDCHDSIPVFCDDEDGIVTKLYQGWPKELVYFERDKAETAHSDLPSHRHSHIKLIARRPLDGPIAD
jgi:SAM-dependent methyltransferase